MFDYKVIMYCYGRLFQFHKNFTWFLWGR